MIDYYYRKLTTVFLIMIINKVQLSKLHKDHFLKFEESTANREKIFRVYKRSAEENSSLPLPFFTDPKTAAKLQAAGHSAQLKKNAILYSTLALCVALIAISISLLISGQLLVPIILISAGLLTLIPVWYLRNLPFEKGSSFDAAISQAKEELKPIIKRTAIDWFIEFIHCQKDEKKTKEKIEEAKKLFALLKPIVCVRDHADREHEMYPLYRIAGKIVNGQWDLEYLYFIKMHKDRKKKEKPSDVGLALSLYDQAMHYSQRLYDIWHNKERLSDIYVYPHDTDAKRHYEKINQLFEEYRAAEISSKDFSDKVYAILNENKMVKWDIDLLSGEEVLVSTYWYKEDLDERRRIFTALVS